MGNRYAPHKISYPNVLAQSFSATQYSKFKYGSFLAAAKMGNELAVHFFHSDLWKRIKETGKTIVVYGAPYDCIPTASGNMSEYFASTLCLLSGQAIYEAKISRDTTYHEDYSAMSKEERWEMIKCDKFNLEYDSDVADEDCIFLFVDDVLITGSYEQCIQNMISEQKIKEENYFIYYAEVINPDLCASIEHKLNTYCIKTLDDISREITCNPLDHIMWNTRLVKFILKQENDSLVRFLLVLTQAEKKKLLALAIGNKYHEIDVYKEGLETLKVFINTKTKETV